MTLTFGTMQPPPRYQQAPPPRVVLSPSLRAGNGLRLVAETTLTPEDTAPRATRRLATALATTTPLPFRCPASTDGSNPISVTPGNVNGVTVTNLSLVVSNSGTQEVYLNVTYVQDLSANNYVIGFASPITCAVATGSSIPADTSTHLYRRIATYVSGGRTTQAITSSMEVAARDDGTGTSTTRAIWSQA